MKKKMMVLALAGTLLLGGCSTKLTRYKSTTFQAGFDTVMTLIGYTRTEKQFTSYFNEMEQMFLRYNALYDVYNDYDGLNNIKTINDNAGIRPVKVDPEIIDLLKTAKEFYELSNGEFDVTMGPVLKIWHQYREEGMSLNGSGQLGNVPEEAALQQAKACTGWDKVEINENDSTVYLTESCASLDVGGIAKGYAAGKVQEKLIENGLTHASVDAGGNIVTINDKPGEGPWGVGIRNPRGTTPTLVLAKLPGSSAFVSSGDYERFYVAEDGNLYHHIIDPKTLYPADRYHQVTIITENSGYADALSTALFTMSYEDGMNLIERFQTAHPDQSVDVMWVMDSEKKPEGVEAEEIEGYAVIMTENMKDNLIVK